MKKLIISLAVLFITGCASHAKIASPAVERHHIPLLTGKTVDLDIQYSQPKPGVFSSGEQTPLKPLAQSEMSVASAATLRKLPDYVAGQLPQSARIAPTNQGEYTLRVEMFANDKKGPSYAEYEFGKSLLKNLFTLGLGSAEYDLIADFKVRYYLQKGDRVVYGHEYKVSDKVDHERGDFESFNSLNDYTGQLLEKHLMLTLDDFFGRISKASQQASR